MENAIIYLLHPSIRPLQAADTLKQYRAFAADPGRVHIRVAVEKEEDAEMFRGWKNTEATVVRSPRLGVCYPLYCLTRKLQGKPADLVIVSSDDFLPTTKGWDDWLLRQFQDFSGLLVLNDGYQRSNEVVTFPILSYQALLKLNRAIYHPAYAHLWSDVELYQVARDLGILKDLRATEPTVWFRHQSWCVGARRKDRFDEMYHQRWLEEEILHQQRKLLPVEERIKVRIEDLFPGWRKVVSSSLWGNKARYLQGAMRVLEQARQFYPTWIYRFYCDRTVPSEWKERIRERGGDVVDVPHECSSDMEGQNCYGMFWRFLAVEDSDVMISRDVDTNFTHRERVAVEEWMLSGKNFHIMRDHPYHTVPILGGMWGCRSESLRSTMRPLISDWPSKDVKGCDQEFLARSVWRRVKDSCLIHDDGFYASPDEVPSTPFPTSRAGTEYVGDVVDENGASNAELRKLIAPVGTGPCGP